MTPSEKSHHIKSQFDNLDDELAVYNHNSQRCAIIAVEEIIEEVSKYCEQEFMTFRLSYWHEVKRHLENIYKTKQH